MLHHEYMVNRLLLNRPSYWRYFSPTISVQVAGLLRLIFVAFLTFSLLFFPAPSLARHPDKTRNSITQPFRGLHNDKNLPAIPIRATATSIPSMTIVIVGDVMPGRKIYTHSIEYGNYIWPYSATSQVLSNADLTLGNLESPLVNGCSPGGSTMRLCASPAAQQGLSEAGFDGLSLANNHSFDYGSSGFQNTIVTLQNAGISPLLNRGVNIFQINGMRIGVIALEDTYATPIQMESVIPTIEQAQKTTDVLIGLIHWGIEYTDQPSEQQQIVGHALIDAGMDIVIGAHPHWTQPIEQYGKGLIFYSLGNFVFDQDWSEKTRQGLVVRLRISNQTGTPEITYQTEQILIDDNGQPHWLVTPDAPAPRKTSE
jgi:poly-gamma-glutamate synthesis protein (capsule biosynthesis protein)